MADVTLTADWSYSAIDNSISCNGIATGSYATINRPEIVEGALVSCKFTISDYVQGEVKVRVGGASGVSGPKSGNGTVYLLLVADSTDDRIEFVDTNVFEGKISDVEVYVCFTGYAVFGCSNGNSVDGNYALTRARAVDFDTLPMLHVDYYPRTQYVPNSTDLTGWNQAGPPIVRYDEVGLTGVPNTASFVQDVIAVNTQYVFKTFSLDAGAVGKEYTFRIIVPKGTAPGDYPGFKVGFTSELGTRAHYAFDPSDGSYVKTLDNGLGETITVIDGGINWQFLVQATADDTVGMVGFFGALSQDFVTQSNAAQGSWVCQCFECYEATIEQIKYSTPIFTSGAAEAVDGIKYAFNFDAHDPGSGVAMLEALVPFSGAYDNFVSTVKIISWNLGWIGSQYTDGKIKSHDGSNVCYGAIPTADTEVEIAIVYDDAEAKQALWQDGVQQEEDDFTGTMGNSYYLIGHYVQHAFNLRNLKEYSIPSYSAGEELIQGGE